MPFMDTTISSWSDTKTFLNMVNSFLCSSTNYFENWLLPNDLIIVRNHVNGKEDEWDIKWVQERQGDAYIKVEIQANSESRSLTSSPTWSLGPPYLQIDVQDAPNLWFGWSTYTWKDKEITFLMTPVQWSTKIWVGCNHRNTIDF
jgi:hypothetical protein